MSPRKTQKQYVSIRELAKEIGVSTSVLYTEARAGKLPGASRIGQRIIIHLGTFMKSMGHDGDEPETPATQEPETPRLVDPFQVAEAVAAQLRPPKEIDEQANKQPLQPWTELAEKKPLVSSGKFQYYNHLSTRTVPAEIIDRIQDLRSRRLTARQILVSMGIEASNARLRGLNPPPVPKMNTVARYSKEFDRHGPRSLKHTQEMMEPEVAEAAEAAEAAEEPRHVIHTDVVSWPDTDDGTELFRIGDQSEHNVGETARVAIRLAFTCTNCKEVKEREEKLVLSVCRPGRRDIEKDIVSYALCSTKCTKEFIDQKDETEWLNTPIGRQLTTEEMKAEGWMEVPTFSTPENTETSGSLWRKLRNMAGGNE